MTSKEALEILVYGLQNNTYKKEDLGITMSKCREIINEDLELLEFLKTNLTLVYSEEGMVLLGETLNDEELETIERWLKK